MKYLTDKEIAVIESAYIEAALWSSFDLYSGEYLDNYELSDDAKETLIKELHKFLADNEKEIDTFKTVLCCEQVGHSFWLSSNGHGAGFFDFAEGKELHKVSGEYKSFDLYLGDDELVYIS